MLAPPLALRAQVATASLAGSARDQSGAAVPSAHVTTRHDATGFSRRVVTGAGGEYRLDDLLPGRYTVTTEKPGFQKLIVEGLTLEVGQKGKLDLLLKVGAARDSVTVRAALSPLEAGDFSVGYRLDSPGLRSLPIESRHVIALVTLGPGAVPRHLGGFTHDVINDVQEGPGAVALNPPIHGGRSTMNVFLLDGAWNTDLNTRAVVVRPPIEAVQEFRVLSSVASAEFPAAGGGVADLVTRTGTRAWHGNAFEYLRNEASDARNFFDDPVLARPVFRRSQFGGTLGGPLPVRSAFFHAAYEGLRGRAAKSQLSIVPDKTLRGGDFRGQAPIFDPLSLDAATGRRRPFANNAIPAQRIDPIARRFLERYEPLPNRTGAASNYLDATPAERTEDILSARVDREFRDSSRVFARYTLNDARNRLAAAFPELPTRERIRAQQAVAGHTLARARWLHEARFSFTRLKVLELPESAFRNDAAGELGVGGVPRDPLHFGLPFFLVTNFSMVTDTPNRPQAQRDNLWHLSESVSLDRGRHIWKLGFRFTRFQLNYLQSRLSRGQFIFTGAFTADPGAAEPGGDPFADFLLGFAQLTERNLGSAQAYLRQSLFSGYVQHDWRVSPRLTINLGLRYEYAAPFTERRNSLLNLDYSALPATPRLEPVNRGVAPDRNNWAPRAGLAWRLPGGWWWTGKEAVFRAGYGVYFSPEIAIEAYDLVRNGIRNERNQTDGSRAPLLTLANGFPRTATTGFPTYFGLDPKARTAYVQQWTAGVQRQLPAGVVAEVAYLGAKGTRLGRFRTFNTPLRVVTGENLPPRPGELQTLRPFPSLGPIIQRQHISNSIYHALQIKAEKRMARRLSFQGSFVWAKSIDDSDSVINGLFDSVGAQDERNLRLERGLSFFHVGRRISGGFLYQLPGTRALGRLLGGFELSGIVTMQDGTPLNPVFFAADFANSGTPNRPSVVPGRKIGLPRSERSADRFFNTDALREPEPFTFGNAGRNILPGPGNNLLDLALGRRFAAGEGRSIEFRAEFFNAFNHPNFGIPGPYPDFGPFFGKIFSTGEPRRLQFALRWEF